MSPVRITTETAAQRLGVQPQTMRAGYCRHGHYMGMVPTKLPNRLLLWPADAIERLTQGQAAAPAEREAA